MLRFPPVRAGEPVEVSASTYATYATCPEQAVARLRGHYPADTVRSFRGGLAHRMFARHLTTGPVPDEEFVAACREEIGKALNPAVGRLRLRPSELRGLIAETGELYQRFKRVSLDGFISAEVALRQEPAPGVVLKGVVDAVFGGEGRVRLVDWKTGQLGRARDQLMFYATLWALEHGVLPLRVEAVSLATGERFELAPDASDAAACLEVTAELVERARESFGSDIPVERIAGPWCRYCPVVADCEEGSSAAALTG